MRDTITVPANLFTKLWVWASNGLNEAERRQAKALADLAQLPRLHIGGTRWWDGNNTMFKARVQANGEYVAVITGYGNGDQYLHDAMKWLCLSRPDLIPDWDAERMHVTVYLREQVQATWDVVDVKRKKDL